MPLSSQSLLIHWKGQSRDVRGKGIQSLWKSLGPRPRHSRVTATIMLCCLITSPLFAADDPSALEAEKAWAKRDQPGQTERAIELWQKALASQPQSVDVLTRLTRACGRAVRHAPTK